MHRLVRTKRHNPECHIDIKVMGEKNLFEETLSFLRKKARELKKQTGQDLSYKISKID